MKVQTQVKAGVTPSPTAGGSTPLPIPYPTVGTVWEGVGDECQKPK